MVIIPFCKLSKHKSVSKHELSFIREFEKLFPEDQGFVVFFSSGLWELVMLSGKLKYLTGKTRLGINFNFQRKVMP